MEVKSTSTFEVFVPIIGWEKTHQISNKGRVLSRGRPLKPFLNGGYWKVNLKAEGKSELIYIHRIVGLHFLPHTGKHRNLYICHLNDIRDRIDVESLWIGSPGDNIGDAWTNGLFAHRITGNQYTVS